MEKKWPEPSAGGAGMLNIDTWFLVSLQPHHLLVDAWLNAVNSAIAPLPNWPQPNADFDCHLAHCIFNQVRSTAVAQSAGA